MLPDWVSNPGPLTYESGAIPTALSVVITRVYCIYNGMHFVKERSLKAVTKIHVLQCLSSHKAPGPDQISSIFLKEMATKIFPLVTLIYQASVEQGQIPKEWKTAVSPVFKKADQILSDAQHGFRKRRSCECPLPRSSYGTKQSEPDRCHFVEFQ